jgi:antitoxin component HigA of HigAB toxin-antitoxin module
MNTMNTKAIESEEQYVLLMQEIEALAVDDPPLESPAGERLDLLAQQIEAYEKRLYRFAEVSSDSLK